MSLSLKPWSAITVVKGTVEWLTSPSTTTATPSTAPSTRSLLLVYYTRRAVCLGVSKAASSKEVITLFVPHILIEIRGECGSGTIVSSHCCCRIHARDLFIVEQKMDDFVPFRGFREGLIAHDDVLHL
jgi:hypothetical protein